VVGQPGAPIHELDKGEIALAAGDYATAARRASAFFDQIKGTGHPWGDDEGQFFLGRLAHVQGKIEEAYEAYYNRFKYQLKKARAAAPVRLGAAFVDKNETLRRHPSAATAPDSPGGDDVRTLTLVGCQRLFLCVRPTRRIARHTVISATSSRRSRLRTSASVASGLAFTTAATRASESFRGRPGDLPRSRLSPRRRLVTKPLTYRTDT
jgi:hypothetical protein